MFERITLEMSLKPFKRNDPAYVRSVVEQLFDQWAPLLKNRRVISVMLWTADGSEILDYSGDLDDTFDWCQFIGGANLPYAEGEDVLYVNLHKKKFDYTENPPVMTYRILKHIIESIKAEGARRYPNATIRVGETFDIGPEFARSDFKYNRHREICTGQELDNTQFLNSYGVLKGDDHHYAGFPSGIPDGTPFGTFLGRQANCFLKDMGFDYLWLSNGVGFSASPWSSTGEIFDGTHFNTDNFEDVRTRLFDFWRLFRKECPDFPLEVRGTNYSAGIDYASDAVPLYDIYRSNLNITPPPNSPWAALNGNFGLELMGHMSRICELPDNEDTVLFRYYIHDPWWVNSPWYDRYEGQPHDIYLPMALSRISGEGKTMPANALNILSIDNSFGDMPDSCVNEPIPHLLKAEKDAPDEAGQFLWIYPLREYTTATDEYTLRQMLAGDWFMCEAISNGLPMSSVVSCDNFLKLSPDVYAKSILVTPVPEAGSDFEAAILRYVEHDGKVIFYGPTAKASDAFCRTFGLQSLTAESTATVAPEHYPDVHLDDRYPHAMRLREDWPDDRPDVTSTQSILDTEDGACLAAQYHSAIWFRGLLGGRGYLTPDPATEYVKSEVLLRTLLSRMGYDIRFVKPSGAVKTPLIMLHRSDNATMVSTYSPNTTVETRLRLPLGAPVLLGYDAELKDGAACYHFPRAEHKECRVFVEQQSGIVRAREEVPVNYKYRRRINVSGLTHATVRFFGEEYCKDTVDAILNPRAGGDAFYPTGESLNWHRVESAEHGTYFEANDVTGTLIISMPVAGREGNSTVSSYNSPHVQPNK